LGELKFGLYRGRQDFSKISPGLETVKGPFRINVNSRSGKDTFYVLSCSWQKITAPYQLSQE
jgi:hypothetical protein